MEVAGADELLFGDLGVPATLPRGRGALPQEVVVMSQRGRLLEGIVAAVAVKGYVATSVADVIAHAGVSRATFYTQFSDKETCFLAAYESGARAHLEYVLAAVRRTPRRLEQLGAATWAFVELLAARVTYAKTFLVEVNAAGSRALALRLATQRRYAQLLARWYAVLKEERALSGDPPEEVFLAAVFSVSELIATQILEGRPLEADELSRKFLRIQIALFGLTEFADEIAPAMGLPNRD
jgi:AcrR family transcriptional regulator